jgi:DNA modification methylase
MELVSLELKNLQELDFDIDLTGFEIGDIGGVDEAGLIDEDAVPEPPEELISKMGDVWILGNHRVMCGDSTNGGDVALLMNGEKADMVFTDPPYGVDYDGINNDSRDGLANLLDKAFENYSKFSSVGASVYCFHSDRCADIFHEIFRQYFHFSSMIIWVKNSLTLSQTDYQSQHEPCLYGWIKDGTHNWYSDRKQTSIWNIDKESVKGHTTPKPVEIISRAVTNSSKAKQLVLDLFLGSGSTLIGCEKKGRRCYGMELDPKYIDVIIKRWQEYTGKQATHADTGAEFNSMQTKEI